MMYDGCESVKFTVTFLLCIYHTEFVASGLEPYNNQHGYKVLHYSNDSSVGPSTVVRDTQWSAALKVGSHRTLTLTLLNRPGTHLSFDASVDADVDA